MVPDYMADRGFSGFRSIWRIARPRESYVIFSLFSLVLWGLALPDEKEELKILNRFLTEAPYESLEPVCSCQQVAEAGAQVRQVYVHPQLLEYMVKLVQATRDNREIRSGVSPRGTLALLHAAQAFGWLDGRTFVVPEDVKAVAVPVMAHRLVLSRGYGSSVTGEDRIREILEKVPVPVEEWEKK